MSLETTLAIIKPCAVRDGHVGEIIDFIRSNPSNLEIVKVAVVHFTPQQAELFYAEHVGRPYFDGLIEHTISGPCWVLALRGRNAISKWRALIGPTNPLDGDYHLHLRARYGNGVPNNGFHGSDSVGSARYEMATIGGGFENIIIDPELEGPCPPKPVVKFKKIHPDAKLPVQSTAGAAGRDLYSVDHAIIRSDQTVIIHTGLQIEIPEGFELQVRSRSGLASRGVSVANSPGTIDSDYRGELCVILKYTSEACDEFVIQPGDRIAQCLLAPVQPWCSEEAEELSSTERGSNGCGSTGGFSSKAAEQLHQLVTADIKKIIDSTE